MTTVEQIALATEKVTRWAAKQEHATAMLTKWKHRLSALQPQPQSQPTKDKLPKLELVAKNSEAAIALQRAIDKAKANKPKPTPTKPKH